MSLLDTLSLELAEMSITKQKAPILEPQIIKEIFMNNVDIYSADRETRHHMLEVPNLYCGYYYDDEDFIYSKLAITNTLLCNKYDNADIKDNEDSKNTEYMECDDNIDYLTYIMEHNLIINNTELDLNPKSVIAKILYIHQYTKSYYTSLRHLRPIDRAKYMPSDLVDWISNVVDTVRILLDKDLFNYAVNDQIPLEMFQEMIYGLELITCHIRLICNHYKALVFGDLKEKHLKKIMMLANNLYVIMIYFWKVF